MARKNTSQNDPITSAEKALEHFLTSEADENIVLVGAWGTGKTYLWKEVVKKSCSHLKKLRYAYVSVADCESIGGLEKKILEATVAGLLAAQVPTVETVTEALGEVCKTVGKHKSAIGVTVKVITALWGQFNRLALENAIICLDDIERVDKLNPAELLHFAADLRDNRNCKVALILNEDALKEKSKEDKDAWDNALDKGANRRIVYAPTPETAFEHAFITLDGKSHEGLGKEALRAPVIGLGIKNIRVIRNMCMKLEYWEEFAVDVANKSGVALQDLAERLAIDVAVLELANTGADESLSLQACKEFPLILEKDDEAFKRKLREQMKLLGDVGFSGMQRPLEKAVLKSIQNGYLPEEAEKCLEDYAVQCSQRAVWEKKDNIEKKIFNTHDKASEIKPCFDKITLEDVEKISLSDAARLLDYAEVVEATEWAETFRPAYIKTFPGSKDSIFDSAEGSERQKKLWAAAGLLEAIETEKKRREDERLTTPVQHKDFLKYWFKDIIENGWIRHLTEDEFGKKFVEQDYKVALKEFVTSDKVEIVNKIWLHGQAGGEPRKFAQKVYHALTALRADAETASDKLDIYRLERVLQNKDWSRILEEPTEETAP